MTPILTVAIIGRPNVGKSALFNRLIKRRQALVDATPGITRDRLYGEVSWLGTSFRVIDTGGLQFAKGSRLGGSMEKQVTAAMEEAQLALFVCDAKQGIVPLDIQVSEWIRRWGKPVLLVVNKVDSERDLPAIHEFSRLGMGDPYPISGLHGLRVDELLDAVLQHLPRTSSEVRPASAAIRVVIVGRPNVGKSSLVNSILNEDRVVVDETPGTTRDPVDSYVTVEGQPYCLIDTAGIRAKRRLATRVDAIARLMALEAVGRCDVCLGVLDGSVGLIQDDLKLFDRVLSLGKPLCLVVNKWDLMPRSVSPEEVARAVAHRAPFLRFSPVVRTSAKTGFNVLAPLGFAKKLFHLAHRSLTEKEREGLLERLQKDPSAPAGLRDVRFVEVAQAAGTPMTFHILAKMRNPLSSSHVAYLEGLFRRHLKLNGVPMRIRLLRKRKG